MSGPIGSACNHVTHPICKLIPPQNWRDSARAKKIMNINNWLNLNFGTTSANQGEEARSQETKAVKSYGGFGTFEPLGPTLNPGGSAVSTYGTSITA